MTKLKEKQNIPEGWSIFALGDFCKIVNGSTPKSAVSKYWNGDLIWVTPNDVRDANVFILDSERKITEEGLKSIGDRFVPEKSIVLSTRAPIGYVAVTKHQTAFNQGCKGIICNSSHPVFLYYHLLNDRQKLKKMGAGSTFPELSTGDLKKHTLLLPPLKEQQKIAGILELVDAEIEQTKSVIKATEKLKRGLMQGLCTRGIGHTKFKQTELGEMPEGWEVVNLEDVAHLSTGTTPSTSKLSYYQGDVPFIKTGQVVNNRITDAEVYISENAVTDYRLKKYKPGTVLMAMYGQGKTRGQVALLDIEACTTQNAAAIEPGNKLDSEYLWFYLKSQYEQLRKGGVQGHISHLNLTVLKKLEFALPPVTEQKKIVDVLVVIDKKINVNRKLLAKQIELKKGLMRDLLSGVKRVKV